MPRDAFVNLHISLSSHKSQRHFNVTNKRDDFVRVIRIIVDFFFFLCSVSVKSWGYSVSFVFSLDEEICYFTKWEFGVEETLGSRLPCHHGSVKSGMAGQEAVMREARWYFYRSKYSQTSYTERHTATVYTRIGSTQRAPYSRGSRRITILVNARDSSTHHTRIVPVSLAITLFTTQENPKLC